MLFFLVYINDNVEVVNNGINLFADDTVLHITFDDARAAADALNSDLINIQLWVKQWIVSFSPEQTKSVCVSLKKNTSASDISLILMMFVQ